MPSVCSDVGETSDVMPAAAITEAVTVRPGDTLILLTKCDHRGAEALLESIGEMKDNGTLPSGVNVLFIDADDVDQIAAVRGEA